MVASITTRAGKGSRLTHAEMDANLVALRDAAPAGYSGAKPHLLRGTIHAHLYPGVVTGAVDSAQRATNGAALQAALDEAAADRRFFEAVPGRYEFTKAGGLLMGGDGFVWRGSVGTELWQYAADSPVVQIGREPSNGDGHFGMSVEGMSAWHGVSPTAAEANAVGILMRSAWQSGFRHLQSGFAPGFAMGKPRWAVRFAGSGGDAWWFSNTMEDCKFGHGHAGAFKHELMSTGNVFRNIYLGGGLPTVTAFSEALMSFDENYARGQGNVFEQLNLEWARGPQMLRLNVCKNFVFDGVHFEGCELATPFGGSYVYGIYSSASFREIDFENCAFLAAGNGGGIQAMFGGYGGCRFLVDGLKYEPRDLNGLDATRIDTDWQVWEAPGADGDPEGMSSFEMRGLEIASATASLRQWGRFSADMPSSAFRRPDSAAGFVWDGVAGGRSRGAVCFMADADWTHHGAAEEAALVFPAALTGTRTLVLSDRLAPAGAGWRNAAKARPGATVKVRRLAGTASGTLAVRNLAAGGALLASNAAAATDLRFRFDGTNWAAVA